MRHILLPILALIFVSGCKKTSLPQNFTCRVSTSTSSSVMTGNAKTLYDGSQFQVLMTGPNGESAALTWGQINSASTIAGINHTYTIPANALPPFTLTGSFAAPYGSSTYTSGAGNNLGGTVTITQNTGLGGVISGTFSFNAINTSSYLTDTVYITQGTFTNVPVVSQ